MIYDNLTFHLKSIIFKEPTNIFIFRTQNMQYFIESKNAKFENIWKIFQYIR